MKTGNSIPKAAALFAALLLAAALPSAPHAATCTSYPSSLASQLNGIPWYCPINQQITAEWAQALPFVFMAVLLSFAVSALIIMIGIAARSDMVRNFGIGELYEATASAIIVLLFVYICATIFGLIPGELVGPINPYATSLGLIGNTITSSENLYTSLYGVYMTAAYSASINFYVEYPDSSFFSTFAAFINAAKQEGLEITYIEPVQVMAGVLSNAILVLWSEYYLIVFFSVAAIPVFLIPGVLFRMFLPTRPFGGMLMALGIGFYLIMPTLFAVAFYFTTPGLLSTFGSASAKIAALGGGGGAISNTQPGGPIQYQLQTVEPAMSSFWLMILFFPGLIIALTYSFVTQLANFIGGVSYTGSRLRSFI
jgi:hypothetical protein